MNIKVRNQKEQSQEKSNDDEDEAMIKSNQIN